MHFMLPPDSPKGYGRHHSIRDGFAEKLAQSVAGVVDARIIVNNVLCSDHALTFQRAETKSDMIVCRHLFPGRLDEFDLAVTVFDFRLAQFIRIIIRLLPLRQDRWISYCRFTLPWLLASFACKVFRSGASLDISSSIFMKRKSQLLALAMYLLP